MVSVQHVPYTYYSKGIENGPEGKWYDVVKGRSSWKVRKDIVQERRP